MLRRCAVRANALVCVCVFGRMRMSAVHLGDDDDEGGAVGVPLYPVVKRCSEESCR